MLHLLLVCYINNKWKYLKNNETRLGFDVFFFCNLVNLKMLQFSTFLLIQDGIYRLGIDLCCNNRVFMMDIQTKTSDKRKFIK